MTITHPEMRRFFMLIPEAVQLVLHAAAQAENGAVYVLEMGEQVKLVDMARDLIRLSGFVPDEDIKIEFIGLRPGEKLYEELVGDGETASPSAVEKILCVRSQHKPDEHFFVDVERLETDAAEGRTDLVLASMRALVEHFAGVIPPAESDSASESAEQATLANKQAFGHDEQPCPRCPDGHVRRSRARSLPERIRREFTSERIYRCAECGWRGWLMPMDFGDQKPIDTAPSPDLRALDATTPATEPAPRPHVLPPQSVTSVATTRGGRRDTSRAVARLARPARRRHQLGRLRVRRRLSVGLLAAGGCRPRYRDRGPVPSAASRRFPPPVPAR